MTNLQEKILAILGCLLVLGFFAWASMNALDNAYMRRCVVWKNCDSEAIRQFEKQGCEILGDKESNRWAECDK